MLPIGILTDSSVQFSATNFPGHEFIKQIPIKIKIGNRVVESINELPQLCDENNRPLLTPPSSQEFIVFINEMKKEFNDIFVILLSSQLSKTYVNALAAMDHLPDKNKIHIFDSGSFSFGLGSLVKNIAILICKQKSPNFIEQQIRTIIPQIYGIFCSPNQSYLQYSGMIDLTQSRILEMVGLIPVFAIEEGQFNSIEKVRNIKNCYLLFEEFLDEFEKVKEISFVYGIPPRYKEMGLLKNKCSVYFPTSKFSNQLMNIMTASILGPKAMGIFINDQFSRNL